MDTNTSTISISKSKNLTAEDLFGQITAMQKILEELKNKVLNSLPVKYGSDAWWEKSDKEALEQMRKGKVIKFENIEELEKHFGL